MAQLSLTDKPASDKQRAFIKVLEEERDTGGVNGDTLHAIMNVLEGVYVTSPEASHAISDLLAQPKKIVGDKIVNAPLGLLVDIPCSKYAVDLPGEGLVFLEVKEYKGTRYLRQLVGAPGTWKKIKPFGARRALLANAIKGAGVKESAQLYGQTHQCCGSCGSPLSDTKQPGWVWSIGPECWKKFA